MAKTAFSIVVIGAVGVGLVWLLGYILSFLQPVLVPLAIAGIIAYLLVPLCEKLTKRGMTYQKSMLIVFASFLLVMTLLAVVVLVPTIGQAVNLYGDRAAIRDKVLERFEGAEEYLTRLLGSEEKVIEVRPDESAAAPEPAGVLEAAAKAATEAVVEASAEPEPQSATNTNTNTSTEAEASKFYVDKAANWLQESGPGLAKTMSGWFWNRLRGAFGFLGYAIGLFLVPIYLYYFLKESHSIAEHWTDYVPLKASQFKNEVVETLTEVNGYLIAFFRGQMLVSLIDGVLVGVALTCIGLPYAPVIGVFVALLGLVPYIGNLLCLIPAVLIAIAHFGHDEIVDVTGRSIEVGQKIEAPLATGQQAERQLGGETAGMIPTAESTPATASNRPARKVTGVVTEIDEDNGSARILVKVWGWLPYPWAYPVLVIGLFFILQQINSLVTAPRIVGDSVGLHPLTVIFSVLFWSLTLGGLLGALLAVPLTASVKVLLRRYIWERTLRPETVGGAREAAVEAS